MYMYEGPLGNIQHVYFYGSVSRLSKILLNITT